MRKDFLFSLKIASIFLCLTLISWKPSTPKKNFKSLQLQKSFYDDYVQNIYLKAHLDEAGLNLNVFKKALTGFYNLKNRNILSSKSVLSIADFDMQSIKKRLFIIDLDNQELILNTWVAHGQNSGHDLASHFSNHSSSNESSLGFYLTGEIYFGKHGRSLKLDGMDAGFNDNARERSIVVHGADYVSEQSINQLGRLGRSQGCPAVPSKLANTIINTMAYKTVLFINSSSQNYYSNYLDEQIAANMALNNQEPVLAQLN